MMAVGGAGSSGWPALRKRNLHHQDEEEYEGDQAAEDVGMLEDGGQIPTDFAAGLEALDRRHAESAESFSGDEAAGGEDAGVVDASLLRVVEHALVAGDVGDPADDAADEDGEGGFQRQVHADGEQHRAFDLDHDEGETHEDADDDQRPGHVSADDALGERSHQSGLRGGQFLAAEVVGLVEDHEHGEQCQRADDDAHQVANLHFGRGAAEDVADLEILQHFTGDRRGDADDGGDAEDGDDSGGAFDADGDHQQGGDDQGAEGESADRVVGGADHADEVSADGGEEEAENDHDDGGDDGSDDDLGEEEVERDHGAEDDGEADEDDLAAEVFFIAQRGLLLLAGLLQIADGALDSDAERLAHAEEGEGRADQHSADGDGTDDGEPDAVGYRRPSRPWFQRRRRWRRSADRGSR